MAVSDITLGPHTSMHKEAEAAKAHAANYAALYAVREIAEWLRKQKNLPDLANEIEAEFIVKGAQ